MGRTGVMLTLTLVVGIAIGVVGPRVLNAQYASQEPVKRVELLKADLVGIEGKEAHVVSAEVAPGMAAGKHWHPGNEFVYVLSGSGTLEAEGKAPLALKPGVTFYQPPKQVHELKNTSQTAPLKTVIFLIADKGQPITVPVK